MAKYVRKTTRDRHEVESAGSMHADPSQLSIATILVLVVLDALLMVFCLGLASLDQEELAKAAGGAALAVGVDITRRSLRHGLRRRAERGQAPRSGGERYAAPDRVPCQRRAATDDVEAVAGHPPVIDLRTSPRTVPTPLAGEHDD